MFKDYSRCSHCSKRPWDSQKVIGGCRPYIYFLTDEHRVLRTPLSCLRSDRILNNLERLELPRLNALAPISRHHYTDFCGLYGLNCDDQVLRFGPDLSRWAQPQETSQARDKITESLNELEKLSDQANQLQTRCQLENQRIVSLNELIFELQQYALSQRDDKEDSLLDSSPAKLSLTAFSQPMITASNSEIMRYFIRLKMESALNIDWNNGWSENIPKMLL
ncbi:hypothetical protein BCR41DRAFT_369438 [Lobosporangium transversale]|uniref:Uncharacterized protein n=1 Tax=Lobosporangium transversale TaxID=64571 RepID=A0A1Y2GT22_9FUNG|nr:hypothetical protein BCR41DRAFT_369438 [Lobosporangium transversale]ORZ21971.1 hypothetical protein BCR41DRAFT_369438 [Lobosporangium transversale]|eukprot:XP_021883222.1 hypothetical protein BCR41DRAFT_369438 [Lobosporangium transversale]